MARPRLGEGDNKRLHLIIQDDELVAIDDWRFANRAGSRSEAVRRLCQLGAALDPWVRATPEIYLRVHEAQEAISAALDALKSSTTGDLKEPLVKAAAQLDDARYELLVHVEGMNRVLDALAAGENLQGGLEEAKRVATSTAKKKAAFGGLETLAHALGMKKGGDA